MKLSNFVEGLKTLQPYYKKTTGIIDVCVLYFKFHKQENQQ